MTYEFWCRPLWDWVMDHLINPEIVRHFEWDAQKVFKYDGKNYSRLYTEPWTGKRFWEIQVRTFGLTHFKIIPTSSEDIVAGRGKDAVSRTLRRQDPARVVWFCTGISHHGKDPKPPGGD